MLAATGNILSDVVTLKYLNWYIQFIVPFFVMLILSFLASPSLKEASMIKSFFTTKHIVFAGLVFALGEMVLMLSMQTFFPVLVAIFLVRISQSLDIILAHHIYKEGGFKLQYSFALITVFLAYFFYFGDSF